jgi:hypothetical protein
VSIEQRKSVKADSVKVAESVSISSGSIEGHPEFSAFQKNLEALDQLLAKKQAGQSQLSPLETAAMDLSQVCHRMAPGISMYEIPPDQVASSAEPPRKKTKVPSKPMAAERAPPTVDEVEAMTVHDLTRELKRRGMLQTGNKSAKRARLLLALTAPSGAVPLSL